MLGITFAYFLGGWVYDTYEVDGVAIFGIIVSAFELLSLLLYVLLDKFFPDAPSLDKESSNAIDTQNQEAKSEAQDPSQQAPRRGKRGSVFGRASALFNRGSIMEMIHQFSSNEIKPALDSFGTSDIGANFINYVFVSEYHSM